jgi:hypothetical protein
LLSARWPNRRAYRCTLTPLAAVFTCTHCNAVPEQVVDGKATIAIVRHQLGCPTLMAQTRTRWPAQVC